MRRFVIIALASAALAACAGVPASGPAGSTAKVSYGDPGGKLGDRILELAELRKSGVEVHVDRPCLSACALVLRLPPEQLCIGPEGKFGFHQADPPNPAMLALLPPDVQRFVNERGGLTERVIYMERDEALKIMRSC